MRKEIPLEEIEKEIPKDIISDLYLNQLMSKENIAKYFHRSDSFINRVIKLYSLKRDNLKVLSNSLLKSDSKHKQYNDIKSKISKEDLYQYYVVEDHYYEEAPKHFGITQWQFDKLCVDYNIRKDRSKTNSKHLSNMYIKYGSKENYFKYLIPLCHRTRAKNYGSVKESYKQGLIKIRKTNLEKYGTECFFNSPYIESFYKKKNSGPNNEFKLLLENNNIEYSQEFSLGLKSYDFKINNILIEINPCITHNFNYSPFGNHEGLPKYYHKDKSQLAKDNKYRCIHIWDWDDKEKIINSLKSKTKINARNCELKIIKDKILINNFLNKYHFQNTCRGQSICLGLFYKDKLIQLMTFGKPRFNKKYEYELLRLCSDSNYIIIGGSERLFKNFVKKYNPNSIISYCDFSKFSGDVYIKLGMKFNKLNESKYWYNPNTKKVISDSLLLSKGFDKLFNTNYGKGSSNRDLMLNNGFFEIYGSGQAVYTWIKT